MPRQNETPTKPGNDTNTKGMGVLAVWTDARAENDAAFNDWYNRAHLPERTGHPGFLNGRRYKAISGSPRYLALYDTESPPPCRPKLTAMHWKIRQPGRDASCRRSTISLGLFFRSKRG